MWYCLVPILTVLTLMENYMCFSLKVHVVDPISICSLKM